MALYLFNKINGTGDTRLWAYQVATRRVIGVILTQLLVSLWYDHTLFKLSTWQSAYQFLFGKPGIAKMLFGPWREYMRTGFSPSGLDAKAGEAWLPTHVPQ